MLIVPTIGGKIKLRIKFQTIPENCKVQETTMEVLRRSESELRLLCEKKLHCLYFSFT